MYFWNDQVKGVQICGACDMQTGWSVKARVWVFHGHSYLGELDKSTVAEHLSAGSIISTARHQDPCQNINKEYYLEVLHCLRDAVRCKRPDLWTAGTWQLHHDTSPTHSLQLIQTFLAKHNIPVVRQAPYSPDMAPCDFWLFPHLKTQLRGIWFESRDDIIWNTLAKLYSVRKEAFQKCF